ncbi:MAG: hypothetical protein MUO94_00335 [Thermoplasmata archaeon]|nr:hypothetical protein [Thermoplasmata archaeon]
MHLEADTYCHGECGSVCIVDRQRERVPAGLLILMLIVVAVVAVVVAATRKKKT